MADGDPIRIGQTNNIESSNPGTGTVLERAANSPRTDPVFTVRNPVRGFSVVGLSSSSPGVGGSSSTGTGVVGQSSSFTGVQGVSNSSSGVFGGSTSGFGVGGTSSSGHGVHGDSISGFGVRGISNTNVGMLGLSTDSAGVQGSSFNSFGVRGFGFSPNSFGGDFRGRQSTNGSSGSLQLFGNVVKFNGEYSEALPHPDGSQRLLYAPLSPESWYEDFGRGELVEGRGRVEFDPDFAAILGIDDGDYHVFLTPEGDSNGLYVSSRSPTAFEVHEQQGGTSSLTFSYRVVAKRKDSQPERLAKLEEPEPRPVPGQVPAPVPAPSRWDTVGEPGEGLDELQGLYANDATTRDHLPEPGDELELALGAATRLRPRRHCVGGARDGRDSA